MVIVAIDYGTKNIGLAYSPDGVFSFPMESVTNLGLEQSVSELSKIIKEKKAELIVFGYPSSGGGIETESGKLAREFSEILGNKTRIKVELVDESFSSVEARSVGHKLG
ncbi:MAG: Holliday junction resolvase RuvX, partial [Caldisericia bacterium]|nr:Holliday junction resolvase RuvX [Caldisericia bacterium]